MNRTITRRRPAITIGVLAVPQALAGLLVALCLLALVPTPAAAQTVTPAPAAEPTSLPYTHDCGGELEAACPVDSDFWGAFPFGTDGNGNFGCDRGLSEGVASHECYNGSEPFARYTQALDDYADSWEEWALDNQRRQLAAGEPLNWVTTLGAHNGYNNRADGYNADPNQNYSFTDQLRGSVRWLDLDLYWLTSQRLGGNIRLCHAFCNPLGERFYDSAIKEIGAWLNWHPQDVILISFEDKVGQLLTDDDRINNPIQLHLDQNPWVPGAHRVYKPGDEKTVCPTTCVNGRWPSQRELLANGKQVVILSNDSRSGKFLWRNSDSEYPGYPNAQAKNIDFDACIQKGKSDHLWRAEPTRVERRH